MLTGKSRGIVEECELVLLSSKPPKDIPAGMIDLGDLVKMPERNQDIPVTILFDRVGMGPVDFAGTEQPNRIHITE